MKTTNLLRLAALGATLGAALAAHALSLSISTDGDFTASGPTLTFSEDVLKQVSPGLGHFDSVSLVLNALSGNGAATFLNAAHTQSLRIAYHLDGVSANLPFAAASGTWSYVSGTGDYANKTGYGTLTQNVDLVDHSSLSTFKGKLSPVPEPASLAALGVGAVGLLRRRRKA